MQFDINTVQIRIFILSQIRIFAVGYVSVDGIYVLTLNGDVLVKRIEFDSANKTIKISSENPRYPDVGVLPKNYENIEIYGKVAA